MRAPRREDVRAARVAELEAEVGTWRAFALDVAQLLASPGAEDMAALTNASDLPVLLECLRGTLAEYAAEVASLRALADGSLTAAETMAATLATGVRR